MISNIIIFWPFFCHTPAPFNTIFKLQSPKSMFLVSSGTSVIGIKYLYVDRAKIFFFSKMLRFQRQGYQMKALLKVDEEYQISDIYRLDFTIFSSKIKKKIKKNWLFDPIIRLKLLEIPISSLDFPNFPNVS